MLEARGLAIGYGGMPIGRGIDLAVGAGEVFCLLGPNGSGKTTLFRTLLALIPAISGEVRLAGTPLAELSRREIARRIAYVPQAETATFAYTVEDMVLMGRTAHRGAFSAPGEEDRREAAAAIGRLGLEPLAGRIYAELSGGQRQLVLIARALAQQAPCLVLDEPTASLDFGNRVRVLQVVRGLAASGLAVILSTHDPDQAFAVGSRAALLTDGRILAAGPPEQALTAAHLSAVYGVGIEVIRLADGRRICVPKDEA